MSKEIRVTSSPNIRSYQELRVYKNAFESAMQIFHLTKSFPQEEKYSLIDQIRRCSRSVCANLAESWKKRRYRAAFIAKLNDAETEASETQFWINAALHCQYLDAQKAASLNASYDIIMAQLVKMIENADKWLIHTTLQFDVRCVSASPRPRVAASPSNVQV